MHHRDLPAAHTSVWCLPTHDGLSLRDIANRTGVSRSTVSLWVRDIELTPAQEAALVARNPARNGQLLGMRNSAARRREERAVAQEHGRSLARACDPGYAMGCMLYWGEGSKSRNEAILVNSDADLLASFLGFLRRYYGVAYAQVAFSVNCFLNNGLTLAEIERWWRERLRLPETCMRAAIINTPSSASRRRRYRVLAHGTGRLVLHSTFLLRWFPGLGGVVRPLRLVPGPATG